MSYDNKVTKFVQVLSAATSKTWAVESGRKFDKIYMVDGGQRSGRYMVERKTETIYAIKSWAQVNKRRLFGSLNTIDQFDWSPFHAVPLPGSDAESLLVELEASIARTYKKRGRPRKQLVNTP